MTQGGGTPRGGSAREFAPRRRRQRGLDQTELAARTDIPLAALRDDASPEAVRSAKLRTMLDQVLRGYGSFPALAVDRMWNLIAANEAADLITDSIPEARRGERINLLRVTVHPQCLARWIIDSEQWIGGLLGRVLRKARESSDDDLLALWREVRACSPQPDAVPDPDPSQAPAASRYFSLLRLRLDGENLSLVEVETVFALVADVTAHEVTVQAFLPADATTAEALRRRAARRGRDSQPGRRAGA